MKIIIFTLIAVIFLTSTSFSKVGPTQYRDGVMGADVVCFPSFNMTSSNGVSPFTPVYLGNFLKPITGTNTINPIPNGPFFLRWDLVGPEKKDAESKISYIITTSQVTDDLHGVSIAVDWDNEFYDENGQFGGSNAFNGTINLIPGATNCNSHASFKIVALQVKVKSTATLGDHHFAITMTATCSI